MAQGQYKVMSGQLNSPVPILKNVINVIKKIICIIKSKSSSFIWHKHKAVKWQKRHAIHSSEGQ